MRPSWPMLEQELYLSGLSLGHWPLAVRRRVSGIQKIMLRLLLVVKTRERGLTGARRAAVLLALGAAGRGGTVAGHHLKGRCLCKGIWGSNWVGRWGSDGEGAEAEQGDEGELHVCCWKSAW